MNTKCSGKITLENRLAKIRVNIWGDGRITHNLGETDGRNDVSPICFAPNYGQKLPANASKQNGV